MTFVEKNGKSVEEAVAEALKELNITAEQADVVVLEEGRKGIFGIGRKDAKVRVTVKEAAVVTETVVYEQEETVVAVTEQEEPQIEEVEEAPAVREPKKFVVNDEAVAKLKNFCRKSLAR